MLSNKTASPRRASRLLALLLALSCHSALAARFDIPAQPLSSALLALANQAGVQMAFTPATVGAARAPLVQGEMAVDEALRRLLAGSGLEFRRDGEHSYTVVRSAASADPSLSAVVVTATRTERRLDEVPASVSVIGQDDIASQRPVVVTDLLRNVEGIDVANSATLAGSDAIRVRGIGTSFGGTTSQVLLDGMPLESPVTGIHLGMKALALQDVERVEVVRGPTSALYGPGAVGGVVNLIARRWQGAPGGEVQFGLGSHDARQVAAAVGGQWDRVDFRLSASDYRTDGFVAQSEPDNWGGRDAGPRDGKERKYGLALGLRPADNQEITLDIRHARVESAWFGGHPNNRIEAKVESYDLGYRYEAGDRATYRLRYRHMKQTANPTFDVTYYFGDGDMALAETDERIDRSDTVDLQADLRLGDRHAVTVGISHGLGEYTTTVDYSDYFDALLGGMPDESSQSKSRLTGVYVQDEYRATDALTLLLGGRWDRYTFYDDRVDGVPNGENSSDSVFTPRVGARYRVSQATSLYVTAGTAYVPALNILKYRVSSRWLDNPDLKPETSTSFEIGANHQWGPMTLRAALFHTDYKDKIERTEVGPQYQFNNVGKVTVDGLELAWEAALAGGWRPYVNYAYTDSQIADNPGDPLTEGKRLQYVARHKLNLGVTYAPSGRHYVRFSGRYVDDYYFDDRNSARNPDHFVADLKAGWRLDLGGGLRNVEVSLAINNLFDRHYSEVQYERMDGRNVWLGLNARF